MNRPTEQEVKNAIKAIVTYHTLPPQIDYQVPWMLKAEAAEELLERLPSEEYEAAMRETQIRIDAYYDPDPKTGFSIAELDAMF